MSISTAAVAEEAAVRFNLSPRLFQAAVLAEAAERASAHSPRRRLVHRKLSLSALAGRQEWRLRQIQQRVEMAAAA